MESLNIFIRSIFIDNMVFAFFFGMCSYIAVSKSVKTALGLGAAVTFVMVMTVPLNYLLYEYVLKAGALVEGVDLSFLTFIVFIATIGLALGLTPLVGELYARGDRRHSAAYFQNGIAFYTLLGFVAMAVQLAAVPLMSAWGSRPTWWSRRFPTTACWRTACPA